MENAPLLTASVKPQKTRIGKPIFVKITAKNPGSEIVRVEDPRPGTGALVFEVTLPGGKEQTVRMGVLQPGTKAQVVNMSVLPGTSVDIDFELSGFFPLDLVGDYKLVLEYTWKPGTLWRSPELTFTREPK